MLSQDDGLVLVFNGEIYNHELLRQELGPRAWRGESDTETLLEAIATWGLEKTLQRAYGMFALALWDRSRGILSLARDRMGEKPLYLAELNSGWAFASELHALRVVPGYSPRLSPDGVASYLSSSVVADDACIINGVQKVPPGHILRIEGEAQKLRALPFETVSTLIERGRTAASRHESPENAANRVERVLRDVVTSQMISDVPLGSFLSGGIDSSLVTALMQESSVRAVKTFSIGFDESGYDESVHAEQVATHLGTDHRTFRVREEDALELVPRLPEIYSEVFSDSSQVPTALLCQLARSEVTVALTGDGGDEVFGGYTRHFMAPRLWARMARIPMPFRRHGKILGQAVQRLGGGQSPLLRDLLRRAGLPASTLDRAARLGQIAGEATSLDEVYMALTRTFDMPSSLLKSCINKAPSANDELVRLQDLTPSEWMMARDTIGYLPSDILVKVDRAAMHASLETRAPFLDARTVETAWSLPLDAKIRDGVGKRILREILWRRVPRELIERPKQGFAIPVDRWLRGELRDWAQGLLSREVVESTGVLHFEPVRDLWEAHQARRGNHGHQLWALAMLQAWLIQWEPGLSHPKADAAA